MNDVAIVGTGQTKFSKDDGDVEKLLFRVHTKKKFIYKKNNADDIYPLW